MKLGISGSRDIGDFDFREYFLLKNLNFRKFANTLGKESVTAIITGGIISVVKVVVRLLRNLFRGQQ